MEPDPMNRQTMLTFIVFTVVCLGASLFATQQLMARKRIERDNAVLQAQVEKQAREQEEATARIATLQQSVETVSSEATALRQKVAVQEQQVARFEDQARAREAGESFKTNCVDSDASQGADAIYVRGFVQVDNARSYDSCQGNRLLEQVCIENPHGSGHWIPDFNWVTCPAGSRCVSGECLR
jgi:cell division protein FtsB